MTRVRQLAWTASGTTDWPLRQAVVPFGRYEIIRSTVDAARPWALQATGERPRRFASVEAAETFAQAEFERRVRACVEEAA